MEALDAIWEISVTNSDSLYRPNMKDKIPIETDASTRAITALAIGFENSRESMTTSEHYWMDDESYSTPLAVI